MPSIPDALLLASTLISLNLNSAAFDNDFAILRDDGAVIRVGALTFTLPKPVPMPKSGVRVLGFEDLYYNRIHFNPEVLDFGTVTQDTQVAINVWNAFFTPRTLNNLGFFNLDGIDLQGGFPNSFGTLQAKNLTLNVAGMGGPSLIGYITFLFDAGISAQLNTLGNRGALFAYGHNWAGSVTERLSWKTDIFTSESGKEQRRKMRQYPRRTLSVGYLFGTAEQQSLFRRQIRRFKNSRIALPMWSEVARLSADLPAGSTIIAIDTTGYDFDSGGNLAFVRSAFDYELRQILTVTSSQITLVQPTSQSFRKNTGICSVRQSTFPSEITWTHRKPVMSSTLEYRVIEQEVSSNRFQVPVPTQYRGLGCFDLRTEASEDLDETLTQQADVADNGIGVTQIYAGWDRAQQSADFRWLVRNRAQAAEMLGWLWYWAGRLNPVWMPSWDADFELATPIGINDAAITVKDWGYRTTDNLQPSKRDVVLVLRDGTFVRRRLISATAGTGNTEVLGVDSIFTSAISLSQVEMVCYLRCVRLGLDEIEIEWITDQAALVKLRFTELTTAP